MYIWLFLHAPLSLPSSFFTLKPKMLTFSMANCLIPLAVILVSLSCPTFSSDYNALISFKSTIMEDPLHALDSWNSSYHHFCHWKGVQCGTSRLRWHRVISVDLPDLGLMGELSPTLARLTYLRRLHLTGNRFQGPIPVEFGGLKQLRYLILSSNLLQGEIPSSLCNCLYLKTFNVENNMLGGTIPSNISRWSSLEKFVAGNNKLVGAIPARIGLLSKLAVLDVMSNRLSGEIPSSVCNLSSLVELDMQFNELSGRIPFEIGRLSKLTHLHLHFNSLSGRIPPSTGNISSLQELRLRNNHLSGEIPLDLGRINSVRVIELSYNQLSGKIPTTVYNLSYLRSFHVTNNLLSGRLPSHFASNLPLLTYLHLSENQFHGPIPTSLTTASNLKQILLNKNYFSGKVPSNLGALSNLEVLSFHGNKLTATQNSGWEFFSSLASCRALSEVDLSLNNFEGRLPYDLVNYSKTLQHLRLENNRISGDIPSEIDNLSSLMHFSIANNLFTGALPSSLGNLSKLLHLSVSNNRLSGRIPYSLGNLVGLNRLYLDGNRFIGNIPESFGNFSQLMELDLSRNRLRGVIPARVMGLSSLSGRLNLSNNFLVGSLPMEVFRLTNLQAFDVSKNKISGAIPVGLLSCILLDSLDLSSNLLEGTIPHALGRLTGLQLLNLSHNRLNGSIPYFLAELQLLRFLDLSFNEFEGQVPDRGVFSNASLVSVSGNRKLCGGIPELHLQSCKVRRVSYTLAISLIASAFLVYILVLYFLFQYLTRKRPRPADTTTPSLKSRFPRVSYNQLQKATNGFSSAHLIGVGNFAFVYKAVVDVGKKVEVAVKVFHSVKQEASASFKDECSILREATHRNLLKVITACSSTDHDGNEFKALIFQYMHNGSLENWLHGNPTDQSKPGILSLRQRINVASDVAIALEYLHTQLILPVAHCALKPSNILLNKEMAACVGDFVLSRLISRTTSRSNTTSIRGTVGYIPPEYRTGSPVSTQGDLYSFGVIILEMVTGKKPTDEAFFEDLDLRTYVERKYPDDVWEIIDPELYPIDGDGPTALEEQCLIKLIEIGLGCTMESPGHRMQMKDALKLVRGMKKKLSRQTRRQS